MAMEVVWTRAFTPVLKTQVYSFALIVFTYLGATFLGSWRYRHDLKKNSLWPTAKLIASSGGRVFLPILAGDPRFVKMDWHADHGCHQRDHCAGQHLPVLRHSGIFDSEFD